MTLIKNAIKKRTLYNGSIEIEFKEGGHSYTVNGEKLKISATGVTSLLDKPALKFWAVGLMKDHLDEYIKASEEITVSELLQQIEEASKLHLKRKDEAANLGTIVHNYAEDFAEYQLGNLKEKPKMPKDPKAKNGVIAFLNWVDEYKVKFIASELLVYSKKNKHGGLMDNKFTMGKEKHKIIHGGDYKTGDPELKRFYDKETKKWYEILRPRFEHQLQVSSYVACDVEESKEKYGSSWILYFSKTTGEFNAFEVKSQEKDYKAFLGLLEVKKRMLEYDDKELLISQV